MCKLNIFSSFDADFGEISCDEDFVVIVDYVDFVKRFVV